MEEPRLARKAIGFLCALLSACAAQQTTSPEATQDPAPAAEASPVFEAPKQAAAVAPAPPPAAPVPVEKPQLLDAARLQEEDADFLNRKGLSKHKPALPLYDTADAEAALKLFTARPYGDWTDLTDRISFRFLQAGHLLGSALVHMKARENGSEVSKAACARLSKSA